VLLDSPKKISNHLATERKRKLPINVCDKQEIKDRISCGTLRQDRPLSPGGVQAEARTRDVGNDMIIGPGPRSGASDDKIPKVPKFCRRGLRDIWGT
jgi:hypothetical protein